MPYIVYIEMIMIDRHDRAHPLGFKARSMQTGRERVVERELSVSIKQFSGTLDETTSQHGTYLAANYYVQ